ncbi:MAG: porin [Xanthobacteraceae bacterium]
MTSIKTVLLGSAAGILATGAAQAADLPVKKAAAAVQYVEVCPAFGRGFYKLPGTDICIRHFGYVKAEFYFKGSDDAAAFIHNSGGEYQPFVFQSEANDSVGYRVSARPGWDFRSPTEFGTLRAVVQLRNDRTSGLANGLPPAGASSNTSTRAHRAYIQWAGFLVGIAASQFIYYDQGDLITSIGGDPKTTTMQVTYEFSAPGGFTATIGLENPNYSIPALVYADTDITGTGAEYAVGPEAMWDVVGTLAIEQSWGSAKLAGAIHQISVIAVNGGGSALSNTCSFGGVSATCATERETGWAVLAGVTFNLPQLGSGDQILLQATHSDGATAYGGVNDGADVSMTGGARDGLFAGGFLNDYGDAFASPNVTGTDIVLEKVKVTSVLGELRHYWTPMLRSNLAASWTKVDAGPISCATSASSGGRCDATAVDVALNLIWGKSRQTAEIGVEVMYKTVRQDLSLGTVLPVGIDEDPELLAVGAFISRSW